MIWKRRRKRKKKWNIKQKNKMHLTVGIAHLTYLYCVRNALFELTSTAQWTLFICTLYSNFIKVLSDIQEAILYLLSWHYEFVMALSPDTPVVLVFLLHKTEEANAIHSTVKRCNAILCKIALVWQNDYWNFFYFCFYFFHIPSRKLFVNVRVYLQGHVDA